jgi:hypothetical protein
MAFAIKINGTTHSVDGDTPLLWVLRDFGLQAVFPIGTRATT